MRKFTLALSLLILAGCATIRDVVDDLDIDFSDMLLETATSVPTENAPIEASTTPTVIIVPEVTIETVTTFVYRVQRDDTLQDLSVTLYGTPGYWEEIYKLNRDTIENPDFIFVGQVLYLPKEPNITN